MRKTTFFILGLFMVAGVSLTAQTTLFSENFNSGAGTFSLNTTDMSSITTGTNTWVVNNSYTGGTVSLSCMGFPFTAPIGTTPAQPGGITGSPASGYMHILSVDAQGQGITNACFRPGDGLCVFAENYFAKKTAGVSTIGYTTSLTFWWMSVGDPGISYGELYFSTNGGVTWTKDNTVAQYQSQGTWIQQTITNAAFNGQASLQIAFRFVNAVTGGAAADPSFSIDDIVLTGTSTTGISDLSSATRVNVFPNPASETVMIDLSSFSTDIVTISVLDQLGREVKNENVSSKNIEMNIAALPEGVYTITMSSDSQRAVSRFVKVK